MLLEVLGVLVVRLSLRPELATEREMLMVSSWAGMVLVYSRQGTMPFSFSSNIWVAGISLKGTWLLASSQSVIPTL